MIVALWLLSLAVLATPAGFWWCCCGAPYTICVYLAPYGCNGTADYVPDLTITVTGPYGYSATQTSSTSPTQFCGLGPGTFSYSVSGHSRFDTKTGTFVVASPSDNNMTVTMGLTPADGYQCFCSGLTYPAAETLYISGPGISGTHTLTWDGVKWTGGGTFTYEGDGCCGLPSGGTMGVTWYVCRGSYRLEVEYQAISLNGCPGASRTLTDGRTTWSSATETPAFTVTRTFEDPFGGGTLFDGLGTGACNATVTYTITE